MPLGLLIVGCKRYDLHMYTEFAKVLHGLHGDVITVRSQSVLGVRESVISMAVGSDSQIIC